MGCEITVELHSCLCQGALHSPIHCSIYFSSSFSFHGTRQKESGIVDMQEDGCHSAAIRPAARGEGTEELFVFCWFLLILFVCLFYIALKARRHIIASFTRGSCLFSICLCQISPLEDAGRFLNKCCHTRCRRNTEHIEDKMQRLLAKVV